jgi:hypothetical protein
MERRQVAKGLVAAVALVAVLSINIGTGDAQSMTYVAQVCKRMVARQVPGGSVMDVSQCGSRFTTQDAYLVLIVTLYNVPDAQTIVAELVDPSGEPVWTRTWTLESPGVGSDRYWESASFWGVLPLSELSSADPVLVAGRIIRLEGKPAAERLGVWTFRVRVGATGRLQRTFTLQAQ